MLTLVIFQQQFNSLMHPHANQRTKNIFSRADLHPLAQKIFLFF
jgi:hypothetical protein